MMAKKKPNDDKNAKSAADKKQASMISTQSDAWPDARARRLPEEFGRYRIIRLLGHGAMGEVYLAKDTNLDRDVALKVPKLESKNKNLLKRFYREAKASAKLIHPYVCSVYDVGEIDGIHFLTMAYIEGKTLAEHLTPGKPMNIRSSATIIRKLALGLAEAHGQGILHRDLKPANIMIDTKKQPVIMDFGLATNLGASESLATQQGSILGTPAYMSPEQVEGKRDKIGPHSDLYSLGILFYQLITGHLPFEGPIASVLGQILAVDPKKPSELRKSIDPELEAICLKAMAKKIGDRYKSTKELAAALADWLKVPEAERKKNQLADSQEMLEVIVDEEDDATSTVIMDELGAESLFDFQSDAENRTLERLKRRAGSGKKQKKAASSKKGQAKQASIWDNVPPNVRWLITAAGGGAVLILLGVIIFIRTRDNTVKIEVDGDDVKVEVIDDGTLSNAVEKAEHGSIKTVVHDFADSNSLDAFELEGRYRFHPDGAIEFLKPEQGRVPGYSRALTKQHFTYPISVNYRVHCEQDALTDVIPELFGIVKFMWGASKNTVTRLYLGHEKKPLKHLRLVPKKRYIVEMSIDSNRTLSVSVDGNELFEDTVPKNIKLSGPIVLGGGIGHVIYDNVKIVGTPVPVVEFAKATTAPGTVLWQDEFSSNRLAEYSNQYPSNLESWIVTKGRLQRKSVNDSPSNNDEWLALPISHEGDFVVEYTAISVGDNVPDTNFRIGGTEFVLNGGKRHRAWIAGEAGFNSQFKPGVLSKGQSTKIRLQRIGDEAKLFSNSIEVVSLRGPKVSQLVPQLVGIDGRHWSVGVAYDDLLVRRPTMEEYKAAGVAPPLEADANKPTPQTKREASNSRVDDFAKANPIGTRPPLAVAPFKASEAAAHQKTWAQHLGRKVDETNSIGMKLKLIPPGEFKMGSIAATRTDFENETPQHDVNLSRPFYISQTEVTVEQFKTFVDRAGYDPIKTSNNKNKSRFNWLKTGQPQTNQHPVIAVSWNDAKAFCEWLSRTENKTYRLPTETEWEFACRGGTTMKRWCGVNDEFLKSTGNVADASALPDSKRPKFKNPDLEYVRHNDGFVYTSPVASFKPNPFDLYDVHGNVWEWCDDQYAEVQSIVHSRYNSTTAPRGTGKFAIRGGSWYDGPSRVRSAAREGHDADKWDGSIGFRVVCEIKNSEQQARTVPTTKTSSDKPSISRPLTGEKTAAKLIPADATQHTALNGRNYSYKVFPGQKTWLEAKEYCENQGGRLVVIRSKAENDFVTGLVEKVSASSKGFKATWIGATDIDEQRKPLGKYTWVNGEEVLYDNWRKTGGFNEPDNRSGLQKRVEGHHAGLVAIHPEGGPVEKGMWYDRSGKASPYVNCYVCQWDDPENPETNFNGPIADTNGVSDGSLTSTTEGAKKDEALETITHTFRDESSLQAFNFLRQKPRIHSKGGLEFLKPVEPVHSIALTNQHYTLPLSVSCEVYCEPDAVYDIIPGMFGSIRFWWGNAANKRSQLWLGDRKISLPHRRIIQNKVHKVELSIDQNRKLTIAIDGETVGERTIPQSVKLSGAVTLSGGIGHVVYKKVRITGRPLLPVSNSDETDPVKTSANSSTNDDGFVFLFDKDEPNVEGEIPQGWVTHASQPGGWSVENGVLIGDGKKAKIGRSYLYSTKSYKDVIVRAKVRINHGGNSGIYSRASFGPKYGKKNQFINGYEAQINSTHGDKNRTGSFYIGASGTGAGAVVPVAKTTISDNTWFILELTSQGSQHTVKVNGEVAAGYVDNRYEDGRIALQLHNPQTKVEFEWIKVKDLSGDESVSSVPAKASDDWQTLFDGKDLNNWQPMFIGGKNRDRHLPNEGTWMIKNKEIVCQVSNANESSWLKSLREYDDFEIELEYQVSRGSNSGLLIRSAGEGYLADVSMEIQIKDDQTPRVGSSKALNKRTGSIYGIVPAANDFSNPVGEWNQLYVRCRGDRIVVAINGSEVVNALMSDHEQLKNRPRTGHVGLFNWKGSAPGTKFRNIRIREL